MVEKKDKSHHQNWKQQVNVKVHIGDSKRNAKRGKRNHRNSEPRGGASSHTPYAQSFNPVYIQSGTSQPPSNETNPLLKTIEALINSTRTQHKEGVENPLIKSVSAHIRQPVKNANESDVDEDIELEMFYPKSIGDLYKPSQNPLGLNRARRNVRTPVHFAATQVEDNPLMLGLGRAQRIPQTPASQNDVEEEVIATPARIDRTNQIFNHITKRWIQINGGTHLKLIKEGKMKATR